MRIDMDKWQPQSATGWTIKQINPVYASKD